MSTDLTAALAATSPAPRTRRRPRLLPRARAVAAAALVLVVLLALVGPFVWGGPALQELSRSLEPPSLAEPLGRDHLGRSVLSRLAHATRLSLALAALSVVTSALVGGLAGVVAAWIGRWVDTAINAVSEVLVAVPALLVVLLAAALADGSLLVLYVGIAIAQSVEWFRVVRARSAVVLAGPAVGTARMLDLSAWHVLHRHLWPELRPVLLTLAAFGVGTSVIALSTLGYVGVGLRPPTAELGLMITESLPFWSQAPWLVLAPVLVLAVTLLALLGVRREEPSA
ncbi:ABC transporter permease [Cellulomonas phragmiteti]|uniref:ABC transporter permease n=1 Tax=Cellulomonas phragmiteti TaxID=478780 RepID=A0ABQ4DQT4_9CELL|nr:ABC transporter permease subunit [Cellulomonas phragmiteti]GIG41714.1 ABC transporter permease [Cellulomonas phragmiteti]